MAESDSVSLTVFSRVESGLGTGLFCVDTCSFSVLKGFNAAVDSFTLSLKVSKYRFCPLENVEAVGVPGVLCGVLLGRCVLGEFGGGIGMLRLRVLGPVRTADALVDAVMFLKN